MVAGYVNMSLTPEARTAVNRMAIYLTGTLGVRVSNSQAVLIAAAMLDDPDLDVIAAARLVGAIT